jgi:hypothetical protein
MNTIALLKDSAGVLSKLLKRQPGRDRDVDIQFVLNNIIDAIYYLEDGCDPESDIRQFGSIRPSQQKYYEAFQNLSAEEAREIINQMPDVNSEEWANFRLYCDVWHLPDADAMKELSKSDMNIKEMLNKHYIAFRQQDSHIIKTVA